MFFFFPKHHHLSSVTWLWERCSHTNLTRIGPCSQYNPYPHPCTSPRQHRAKDSHFSLFLPQSGVWCAAVPTPSPHTRPVSHSETTGTTAVPAKQTRQLSGSPPGAPHRLVPHQGPTCKIRGLWTPWQLPRLCFQAAACTWKPLMCTPGLIYGFVTGSSLCGVLLVFHL